MNTVFLSDRAGRSLAFNVLDLEKPVPDMPGNYIFFRGGAASLQNALVTAMIEPIYIGTSESLFERLSNHDRWEEAQRKGATHIAANLVPDERARKAQEEDLIRRYNPPLNEHYTQRSGLYNALVPRPRSTAPKLRSLGNLLRGQPDPTENAGVLSQLFSP